MKTKTLLTLLLLILFNTVFGQQKKDFEIEIERLLELSSNTMTSNTDSSIIYANTAITYAKDRDSPEYISKSYEKLGTVYQTSNNHKAALEAYQKAINYAKKSDNEAKVAHIQTLIARVFTSKSNFKDAIIWQKKANKYALENNDTTLLANTSLDIGVIHARKGEYYIAIEYFFKSLEYNEAIGETKYTIALLNNIGSIYSETEEYEKALTFLKKAKERLKNEPAKKDVYTVPILTNIGRCHVNLGQYEAAIKNYELALSEAEKINNLYYVGFTNSQLGASHLEMGNIEKALKAYNYAYDYLKADYPEEFAAVLRGLSKVYQEKGQYNKALKYIEESSAINISIDNLDDIMEDYRILSSIHNNLGHAQKAYDYLSQHLALKDSVFNIDKSAEVILLESKYNYKQEELRLTTEVNLLKKDKVLHQSQRTILGLSLILVCLILTALVWFFYRKNKENYLLRKDLENKAIIEQQAQELRLLNGVLEAKVEERTVELQTANKNLEQANYELRTFNYIASHDIKEPIRVISGYVNIIFKGLTPDLKQNLGNYFDIIKRSSTQLYTLIEDFARYMTLSQNETIEKQEVDLNYLTFSVMDGLRESIQKYNGQVLLGALPTIQSINSLLFVILKNLIENGLKYNQSDVPTVEISYNQTQTHHEIIVSDNGIGIDEKYKVQIFEMFKRLHNRGAYEGSGIGLAIVKLSADKLGGEVRLESEIGKGSRFIITIPQ